MSELELKKKIERLEARNAALEATAERATKAQADLESLIENIDDYVLVSDAEARPIVFNEKYAQVMKQMLGIEMRPGIQPHTYLESAEQRAFWEGLHRRVLSGERFKAEFDYEFDGETLTFEVAYNPVFAGDEVVGFCEYTRDITSQKRTEAILSAAKLRSESDYRLLMEKMLDGVVVCEAIRDAEGKVCDLRCVDVNPTFERIMGFPRAAIIGRALREIFPALDEEWFEFFSSVLESGEPARIEKRLDEVGAHLDVQALRPRDDLLVSIFQDVTSRVELERERRRADRLQSVGLLAGGIAHDFNNILTSLLGNVELALLEISPNSNAAQMLAEAENACERASGLTKQLLAFSRGGRPVKELCSLGELLDEWCGFTLRGSNVSYQLEVDEALASTEIDAGQVGQVVSNLLINAVQAMPAGGFVRVRVDHLEIDEEDSRCAELFSEIVPGLYVRLRVTDTGVGMDDDTLSKIFDPYFTTKQHGSGLGLATCYAIVRSHQGAITARSVLGEGTTFEVLLPAFEGEVHPRGEVRGEAAKGAGRVLFMDDDEPIRAVASAMLARLGYEVTLTSDGEQALAAFREALAGERPYDVVILDLTVRGGLGGADTIVELLKLDPAVRAVVSSGYCGDSVLANYHDYGFSGVVAKPYQIKALAEVLEDVLSRR